jgi:hypothetical protein
MPTAADGKRRQSVDNPSARGDSFHVVAIPAENPEVRVANAELATVREAMRDMSRLLDALDTGEVEKVVLTQRNQMRAVLITVERYAELEAHATR